MVNLKEEITEQIEKIQKELSGNTTNEVIRIVHEVIDDTPFKTRNNEQYSIAEDEYYIKNTNIRFTSEDLRMQLKKVSHNNITQLLQNRQSVRDYSNKKITYSDMSTLMGVSFGLKETFKGAYSKKEFPVKTSNSQGGLNYLDLYLLINNVENIDSGIYYYDFLQHELVQLDYGNVRPIINKIHYQNEFTTYGNLLAIYVADFKRISWKYLRRSYRFAHVDAGIAVANLQLVTKSLGLGSCIVAGYLEHEIENYLELPKDEIPIVSVSIGTI